MAVTGLKVSAERRRAFRDVYGRLSVSSAIVPSQLSSFAPSYTHSIKRHQVSLEMLWCSSFVLA